MNTQAPLRVDVWSDFVCPFCFIGALRLKQLAAVQPLQIVWHAFMLRPPGAPAMTAEKHAMISAGRPRLEALFREEFGLEIHPGPLDRVTHPTHVVAQYAQSQGCGEAFVEAAMRAYWLEGKAIDERPVLERIARSVGLDLTSAGEALATSDETVAQDLHAAEQYDIHAVPTFIFGEQVLVQGAQPLELLMEAAAAARKSSNVV